MVSVLSESLTCRSFSALSPMTIPARRTSRTRFITTASRPSRRSASPPLASTPATSRRSSLHLRSARSRRRGRSPLRPLLMTGSPPAARAMSSIKSARPSNSTDAGNIGPVGEAFRARANACCILVTPAFPETGRTVYLGHLFVGLVPLNESPLKDHPLNPMRDSNLVRVLGRQSKDSGRSRRAAHRRRGRRRDRSPARRARAARLRRGDRGRSVRA